MIRIAPLYILCLTVGACSENQVHSLDTDDSAESSEIHTNQAPSAPVVRISPETPSPGDDLRCQRTQPSVDPDGDELSYLIRWEVDGQSTDYEQELIPSSQTQAGESWSCWMSGTDGQTEGPAGTDTVQISDQNQAPSAPVVQITPGEPGVNHPLHCQVLEESTDPNGDTVTYQFEWTQNGGKTSWIEPELSSEWTVEGDSWTCTARAFDGELFSESADNTVQIGPPAYGDDITDESGVVYDASGCSYCPDEDWYTPDKAFDNSTGTGAECWVVPWSGGPEWISVDFGAGNEKTVTHYGLMGATFHEGYRARDWELQASHDETTWDVLHSVTDADLPYVMYGGEPFTYYDFTNTQAYRYYRLYVTENMGGQPYNNELGIVEIEMMENAPIE